LSNVLARNWSESIEPRRVLYGALALFLVSFTLLHYGFYHRSLILDTHEYHRFGLAIVRGEVPYRDFRVEYPPGALPTFALPAIGTPGLRARSGSSRWRPLRWGRC
jgi:hypothetical protein